MIILLASCQKRKVRYVPVVAGAYGSGLSSPARSSGVALLVIASSRSEDGAGLGPLPFMGAGALPLVGNADARPFAIVGT